MLRVGVIGLGYWGPNLVRCLDGLPDCEVVAIVDRDQQRLEHVARNVPEATTTTEADDVIDPMAVDAIVLATPTKTHYALARQALLQGIHVFVEKPLATTSAECEELIRLAAKRDLTLFVGHIFLHSAPVVRLKELVDGGNLGDICYIASSRLNLGPIRRDVNALWDLAPHDVSIMLHLLGELPTGVRCSGLAYLNEHVHDVCSLMLDFGKRRIGISHVSWLDPRKKREMTVVGSKQMAVYNDLEPLEKIKVYDIGVETPDYADSFGEYQFTYRYGDTYSPRLEEHEPLKAECQNFVRCVLDGSAPITGGENGLHVVAVLEAAEKSLHNGGGHVEVAKPNGEYTAPHSIVRGSQ